MRVTGNTFTTSFMSRLNLLTSRQQQLQTQASTGQRLQAPEDDPVAMQRTLNLRSEMQSLGQYRKNISVLADRATSAYNVLSGVKKLSDRAGEIATLADGTRSPQELATYANQVTQMIKQAVQAMNSKYGNDRLFGGTASNQPPFVMVADANGNVTSVTYQGNTSVAQNLIADNTTISVDVPGANTSGTGPRGLVTDSRHGADFFNHLISLQNNLLAGDTAAIAATDRPALARDEENLIYQISSNEVTQAQLETVSKAAQTRSDSVTGMISNEADADLTETLVQLSQTQNAYQAALQSGASLMQMSLLNYLS